MTNEILTTVVGGGVGLTVGGVVTFLTVSAALKKYIRDVAGVKPDPTVISPQPLTVQAAAAYTTRESFHKHAELNRLTHEQIHQRINNLEGKINSLSNDTAAVNATLKVNGERLSEMDMKIDSLRTEISNVPAKVIATLRDTKDLI